MRTGVEGFVAGRLTMAREARGLRQVDLAAMIDRSAPTISKYESNAQRPDQAVVQLLASALGVGVAWFFIPLEPDPKTAVFYRSLATALDAMRAKARARLGFVEVLDEVIADFVDLPAVDVPDLLQGRDFRTLRDADIELFAHQLREHWDLGDGPIDDLMIVIENAGIVVAEDEIGSSKLDGVSRWSARTGRPYMLLAKDKQVGCRRRFDAAHELAHLVLHRNVSPDELVANFSLIEEQAMNFAGSLLMPEDTFGQQVYSYSLEALAGLKPEWKASVGAMIKRIFHLGMISDQYERRLWQYYSYRKWKKEGEPHDDEIAIEQPENLRQAIRIGVEEGVVSPREFLLRVGMSASDICSLTGLPEDFFDQMPANVVRLPLRTRSPRDTETTSPSGDVVSISDKRK